MLVKGPLPPEQGNSTRLNQPDLDGDALAHELAGEQQEGDQVAYLHSNEVEMDDDDLTDTELYEGETATEYRDTVEGLADREMREGETSDPEVAAQEGLTWVPPVDPPVVTDDDDPQGIRIAAGFGTTAEDDPYDTSHETELVPAAGEFHDRIRDALRADAATSDYAETIIIGTRGRTVVVRGTVDDIDDTDTIVDVISRVSGVEDVIDEIEVHGITD